MLGVEYGFGAGRDQGEEDRDVVEAVMLPLEEAGDVGRTQSRVSGSDVSSPSSRRAACQAVSPASRLPVTIRQVAAIKPIRSKAEQEKAVATGPIRTGDVAVDDADDGWTGPLEPGRPGMLTS